MSSMDGEKAWSELINTISAESRERFHRLNLTLTYHEPSIDDVSMIDSLISQATQHIRAGVHLRVIRDLMYAAMFYFELDCMPDYVDGRYICTGHIFCRLNLSRKGRETLYRQLLDTSSQFVIDGRPVPCVERMPSCIPPFMRKVRFTLPSMNDSVGITVRGVTLRQRTISGLPKTLKELAHAQVLDAPFGSTDHSRSVKMLPELPPKRKFHDAEAEALQHDLTVPSSYHSRSNSGERPASRTRQGSHPRTPSTARPPWHSRAMSEPRLSRRSRSRSYSPAIGLPRPAGAVPYYQVYVQAAESTTAAKLGETDNRGNNNADAENRSYWLADS